MEQEEGREKRERTRANWKVKEEVNVKERAATQEMGMRGASVCKLMVMCLKG